METFDLQRIFIGDFSWWFLAEIAFRTTVMYLYTIIFLRLTGSRGIGQLSAFDIAIIIAMGSAVGDPMFYPEVPLLHGLTVITVIVLIQRGISFILVRRSKVEGILEGKPVSIVEQGRLESGNIAEAGLSQEDIFMRLRHAGVQHLGEVQHAYLEHDGQFSIFKYKPEAIQPGLPITPPRDIRKPEIIPAGETPPQKGVYACLACGQTITAGPDTRLPPCSDCEGEEWVRARD